MPPVVEDDPQSRVTWSFDGPPLGAPAGRPSSSAAPAGALQPPAPAPVPAGAPSVTIRPGAGVPGPTPRGPAHPGSPQGGPRQPDPALPGHGLSPSAPRSAAHAARGGSAPVHPALVVRSPTPVLPVPTASVPVSRRRRTAIEPAQPDVAARTRRPEVYDMAAEMPAAGPIPRTPRPLRITLGILFLILAAGLGLLFLPGHKPLSPDEEAALAQRAGQGEVLRQRESRLSEEVHLGGSVGAGALALAGIGFVLSGALHRAAAQVRCRRCQRPVVAWKGAFGLYCPLGEHYARVQWLMVGLTALFWIGLLAVAAFIGLWIM